MNESWSTSTFMMKEPAAGSFAARPPAHETANWVTNRTKFFVNFALKLRPQKALRRQAHVEKLTMIRTQRHRQVHTVERQGVRLNRCPGLKIGGGLHDRI